MKNRLFVTYEDFFDETTYMTMVMYRFITSIYHCGKQHAYHVD